MSHVRKATSDPPEQEPLGSYSRLSSPRLIGRDEEFALALKTVLRPPAVVLVEGEAGVGKTRLVREILAEARLASHRRLVGHSDPLDEPLPLEPIVHILASLGELPTDRLSPLAGALRPLVPELSDQLPPALDPLDDPRAERQRLMRAITEVLDGLGHTIVVFEDIHWADRTTLEFLSYLTSHQPPRLSLIATYRSGHNVGAAALAGIAAHVPASTTRAQVALSTLSPNELQQLVSSILQADDVSAEFVSYLYEKTAGVPFAVEELLRLMQERRDVILVDGRWARRSLDALQVPAAVRDSILERADKLPADARRVLEASAVLGVRSTHELVAEVAGMSSGTVDAVGSACSSGLLQESDGVYDLRHALARQALYESMNPVERGRMHVRAARALETRSEPLAHARIAKHYKEGACEDEWLNHAEAAADRAVALHDYATACGYLEEIVNVATDPLHRGRLALKLAEAALQGLQHHRVISLVQSVLTEDLGAGDAARLRFLLGLLLAQGGRASEGVRHIAESVPELPGSVLQARAAMVLASPLVREGDRRHHLTWLEQSATASSDRASPRVASLLVADRAATMLALGDRSQVDAAIDIFEDGTVRDRRDAVRAYLGLAYSAFYVGDYALAQRCYARHLDLSGDVVYQRLSGGTASTGLLVDWAAGRWDGLEERARQAAADFVDVPCVWVDAAVVLGHLLLARGDTRLAEEMLRDAMGTALTAGSLPLFATAAAGLIRVLYAREEVATATEVVQHVADVLRAKEIWVWGGELWDTAIASLVLADRREDAELLVRELRSGIRGLHAPAAKAGLAAARAATAPDRGDLWHSAYRTWTDIGRPYEAARMLEQRGAALLRGGKAAGERHLLGAVATFSSLGAEWDAARARRALRSHGVGLPSPWRGGRRGYGTELSPREREVAQLASTGKTNKEIAQALFLSTKTVEHHVSSVMHKLGVASRRELAGRL